MCSALAARKPRDEAGTAPRPYALGYSDDEFRRLERQGTYYRDLTEDVLLRAGIGPGMRVLDIGCGVGDVTLIAARLVGPTGAVVGVDRSAEAIATAAGRIARAGYEGTVRFLAADLDGYQTEPDFDAVIGRLILMYLPDPAGALRRFATCLRPGGVIAFHEMSMPQARTVPACPLFDRGVGWIMETFIRAGFEIDMGGKLFAAFRDAGLPAPEMISASRVEGGPDAYAYDYLTQTLRSLLPVAERVGTTTRAEVGIDTLAARLRAEALGNSACILMPALIGAWARIPA